MSVRVAILWIALATLSCSHIPARAPQSSAPDYNQEKIQLLKMASAHGVLFQISDSVIHDVPMRSIGENCRKAEEGQWVEQVYSALKVFQAQPALLGKTHLIEFRRGDTAGVEISRDLDGAVSLILHYAKVETRQKVVSLSEIPCAESTMESIGKDLVITHYEWPGFAEITAALEVLPERPVIARLTFDHRFTNWLADRVTILRLTPDLAFEKSPTGEPFLAQAMARLSDEIARTPAQPMIDFWLKEISGRSTIGASLKFFAFKRDIAMSSGLLVDSTDRYTRRLAGYMEPTYLFISYRLENGVFQIGTLADLTSCLSEFSQTYRSPLASMNNYDLSPETFLAPGHSCEPHTP